MKNKISSDPRNVEKLFIDLSDIIRYIGNGTRPYVEGEGVYSL